MKNRLPFIFLIICLALSFNTKAQAPGWAWAANGGGTQDEEGKSITTDLNGNVFVTGFYRSRTIKFGNFTLTNVDTSGATDDVFLVKYDSTGLVKWAKSFGGKYDDEGTSINTDYNGNVYLTGNFTSLTMKVGYINLTNTNTDSLSLTYDGFTAKFNSLGNVQWAKSFGNLGDENINGVSVDLSGNIYITGNYSSDTVYFDTSKVISDGTANIFIAKLNLFGDVLWAKYAGGNKDDKSMAIATDSVGNIAITGYFFSSTITFGSTLLQKRDTTGSPVTGYSNDIFIAKYNPNGGVMWARSAGGSNLYVDDISSNAIAMNTKGDVYITGYFRYDSLYFGHVMLTGTYQTRDIFIAKYTTVGNMAWAKQAGRGLDDEGRGIAVDKSDNIYVAGYYSADTIVFDTVTLSAQTMDAEMYVVKLNPSGNVIWAKSAGGTSGDFCNSITAFNIDKVYITGQYYSSTISFDGFTVTNQGTGDVFVARLYPLMDGVEQYSRVDNNLIIYPNPSVQFATISYSLKTPASISIEIYNELGEKVSSIINNVRQSEGDYRYVFTAAQSGIYFVKLQSAEGVEVKRVVFTK